MTDQPVPRHDQLPLPDYDHLPQAAVESRIRTLDGDQLTQLLAYERAHADRPAVVQVLERRVEQLRAGATPTSGDPMAETPEVAPGGPGMSPASPQTEGPHLNPPPHGVPPHRKRHRA